MVTKPLSVASKASREASLSGSHSRFAPTGEHWVKHAEIASRLLALADSGHLPATQFNFKSKRHEQVSNKAKIRFLSSAAKGFWNAEAVEQHITEIYEKIDYYSNICSDVAISNDLEIRTTVNAIINCVGSFLIEDYDNLKENEAFITRSTPTDASIAFLKAKELPLCVPKDGTAKPYPGKKVAGDVRAWLSSTYPFWEGGEPLSLAWLEQHDPRGYRALYKQSTRETGPPSRFLSSASSEIDDLLAAHLLELKTPQGVERAKRVHSALTSRLFSKHIPKRKMS